MVAIKAHQAAGFIAKPDPKIKAVLLYGPDAGLVSERAQAVAHLFASRETPAGEVVRIDDSDLETESDRLELELLTIPMFGGPKVVRTSTGRRVNAATLGSLLGTALAGALVVEAGNLRPDDKVRALFEKSATAAAVPCYPDQGASLEDVVDEALKAAGVGIAPDARQELLSRLGADRGLSRAEIEKLIVYAHGAPRIELQHVEDIVGDAAENAVDLVIAAAASGDMAAALAQCDRMVAGGESAQSIILAAERHFHRLHRLRAGVDSGRSLDELMRAMRPPLPPRAKTQLERQARAWTTERAGQAIGRIADAVRQSRTTGADETVIAERVLLEIARLGRAAARR